jgi:excisionase family DNA binding protein
MVSKKEAAEYLGVSTRAVERYTASGKLPCIYTQGKFGKEANYNQEDLEKFKGELQTPTYQPEILDPPTSSDTIPPPDSAPLSRVSGGENLLLDYEERFLVALENLANRTPVSEKLLLSLKEAQKLTGLSREFLREAIKLEKLQAQKIGRGWKIKRKDLDFYIDNL